MVRDPRSRPGDYGAGQETPSELAPDEMTEPDTKHDFPDADWLSMTAADPAFFLKDSGSE